MPPETNPRQIPATCAAPATQSNILAGWRALIWVPSLYLAMGLPNNVITGGAAARMYKSLGYTDGDITIALGNMALAWSLKPLWAAFLETHRTKKYFVLSCEIVLCIVFALIALALPLPRFFSISVGLFWIVAFTSATQDTCADGIYLTSLSPAEQSKYAGLQGGFWVLGRVLATGVFIALAEALTIEQGWSQTDMWRLVMAACALAMFGLIVVNRTWLPSGSPPLPGRSVRETARVFSETARSFFDKPQFWGMLAFVFLYRLGEGLILLEGSLFLQSDRAQGGLGLSAGAVSSIDAIWGTGAGILGGLLGGWIAARIGLRRALLPMALCLNIPHLTYVALSQAAVGSEPVGYEFIVAMVSIEKFGYGFGFVGNMIYLMQQLAPGRSVMAHYAYGTALMSLMMVPTGMISGPLAELVGFRSYFLWVMIASVPSVWAAWRAPFPIAERGDATQPATEPSSSPSESVAETELRDRERSEAGRSSMWAMAHILLIIVVDTTMLGFLETHLRWGSLAKSCAVALLLLPKALASWKSVGHALAALRIAKACGEGAHARNARGALVATNLCILCDAAIVILTGISAFRNLD